MRARLHQRCVATGALRVGVTCKAARTHWPNGALQRSAAVQLRTATDSLGPPPLAKETHKRPRFGKGAPCVCLRTRVLALRVCVGAVYRGLGGLAQNFDASASTDTRSMQCASASLNAACCLLSTVSRMQALTAVGCDPATAYNEQSDVQAIRTRIYTVRWGQGGRGTRDRRWGGGWMGGPELPITCSHIRSAVRCALYVERCRLHAAHCRLHAACMLHRSCRQEQASPARCTSSSSSTSRPAARH